MTKNKFEIELESSIDSLPVIGSFLNNALVSLKADEATIYKIQLAVDEASTNVINYAYPGSKGPLKVTLEQAGKDLLISITDKGKPFDPTKIPPPDVDSDLETRKIGGLGIYFMHKLMDSVNYSYDPREGNKLTLRKSLSAAAADSQ